MRTFPRHTRTHPVPIDRLDLPGDTVRLGTDRTQRTHYYSRAANTVVVVTSADKIGRRQRLDAYSLTAWVTHIANEHGWRELRHAETFLERLADSLPRRRERRGFLGLP